MNSKVTSKLDFLALELARRVRQEKKRRSGQGILVLAKPLLPDWWSGDPNFAELVPKDEQEEDMEIQIPLWANSAQAGETDVLRLEWQRLGAGNWTTVGSPINFPGPLDPADFPTPLTLPQAIFQNQGEYELRYQVTTDAGVTDVSSTTLFIIDKTPPNGNQSPRALTFNDTSIIADGITADYLAANGGVDVTIPSYTDVHAGDSAQVYVFNRGTTPTVPVFTQNNVDNQKTFKIPTAAFNGLQDGMIYLYYRLLDKVGNRGPTADNAETGLFINPVPVPPLAAPQVPRIADDGVLHLADLAQGDNLVEIALYGNWLEHDLVECTWGTATTHATHDMTSADNPIILNIPYPSILKPAYGAATGPLPTVISYVVRRGNKTFASGPTTINVDFFVPGPVNPERPRPVNPNLPRVTVKGTGPNAEDNVLKADDVGLEVEVTVALYAPIGTGEEMLLYWYSIDNQVSTFSPVAGTPGDPYTFTLDWDDIKDLPSGTEIPVFYTVGLVSGTGNIEACVPTLVDVSAALPIHLATPEFPDAGEAADGSPILNCTSYIGADQHVVVHIPPNAPLLTGGEQLAFSWQCYTDRQGTVPAGSPQTFTKTLTAAEANSGYSFNVQPFDDYILPVGRNGSVRLTYESNTTPVMQGEILIRAAALNAGGVCEPNSLRRV